MDLAEADAWIESVRPRPGLRPLHIALLAGSLYLGATWADPQLMSGPLGWLLPQVVLIALLVMIVHTGWRQRQLAGMLEQVFEAVQLRDWAETERRLQALRGRPIRYPIARAELLLSVAALAEARGSYDAAQRIYESLLQSAQADPLQLHTAQVGLAAAMLRTGQVTDAVSAIQRLERAELPDTLRAQIELLALFKEVTMGQSEDAVARADQRRQLFREHLGTLAGYGYGLLAAAFDRMQQAARATSLWHDATLLVRPAELLARFPELKGVAAKYPATELPF